MSTTSATQVQQGELRLRRPFRPVLVDMNAAIRELGYHVDVVNDMVHSGELLWVFDVRSPGSVKRELRFWLGELLAPAVQRGKSIDDVTRAIVGHERFPELRGTTVEEILFLRKQSIPDLCVSGGLTSRVGNHVRWITRNSLVEFLRRRWVGA